MDPLLSMYMVSAGTNAALSALGQGSSNQALTYQARVAEANAELARQEGDYAFQAAHRAELEARMKGRQVKGAQRTSMAASGFALSSGSYQDILEDTQTGIELDARALAFGGELDRWRAEGNARNFEGQADAARASRGSPLLAAGKSIIGSMGQYYLATYDPKAKTKTAKGLSGPSPFTMRGGVSSSGQTQRQIDAAVYNGGGW